MTETKTLALIGFARWWKIGRLRVADRGLRKGLLPDPMAHDGHHPSEQTAR
ncbi:MAG: hypothetical protein OXC54_02975 [Rhodospirillaceae bacterium]|nr:hypothetical protein [Rhodospirillaceae bacterium]